MAEFAAIDPVRRTVTVRASRPRAFAVFTAEIGTWWPSMQHVGPTPAEAVIEPFTGGRCYARAGDGTETDWGRVLDWEPPSRLRFAWLLSPDWEYEPDPGHASEVDVQFTTADEGATTVTLEHRGFERYGDGGEGLRNQVDSAGGWGHLLERYADLVRTGPGHEHN
ncbi:MAG: SRPBCC family protein [Actinomycetota bacterium]|nr:SRPBCC family protein [Actinomycetota bacterium]